MKKIIIGIIIAVLVVGIGIFVFIKINKPENVERIAEKDSKVLIVYYSRTGNTETIAKYIRARTNGELVKLDTEKDYPNDMDELKAETTEEKKNNARPALKTKIENIDDYDIIFVGYPIWFDDMPMAVYTFLEEYDLSEKTIVPFATSGSSGLSGTPSKIENITKAKTASGFIYKGSSPWKSEDEVGKWLTELGFEGE